MRATFLIVAVCLALITAAQSRSFTIENARYMKDGQPFLLRSGSFHYHRCVPELWRDRLMRMAAMGLNAVQTYVPWNFHERAPGQFTFEGRANLTLFLETAQELGLLVLLRAGPYICGEHDFGGIPPYLVTVPGTQLRTDNAPYLQLVDRWWSVLLPLVKPLLYSNGGPIVMMQLENEFGSYGDVSTNPSDKQYMLHLLDLFNEHLGQDAVLHYTTDGGDTSYLTRGALRNIVFATGDFGPTTDIEQPFNAQDEFNPPEWRVHMNPEYYTGWLTHWGEQMANTSSLAVAAGLTLFGATNASFNFYMAYGGTNYGFWNGANGGGSTLQPVITSYDYDSPISEGGGHGYGPDGDKYATLQQVLSYWEERTFPQEPPAPAVEAYGTVQMKLYGSLLQNKHAFAAKVIEGVDQIGCMESYGLYHGYMMYETKVPADAAGDATVLITGIADSVQVFIGDSFASPTVYRWAEKNITIPQSAVQPSVTLSFFVENMGHLNYGRQFFDPKGILGNITWNGKEVAGPWTVYLYPFDDEVHNVIPKEIISDASVAEESHGDVATSTTIRMIEEQPLSEQAVGPRFFTGTLEISDTPADTYLTVCGWTKGVAWINGFALGRYWETEGPQHTLYVPGVLLRKGENTVTVFEMYNASDALQVRFVDAPDFTGAVCQKSMLATINAPALDTMVQITAPLLPPTAETAEGCPVPYIGQHVSLQPCSGSSTSFKFDLTNTPANAGLLRSTVNPAFCVVVNGKNPETKAPNLAIGHCDETTHDQVFFHFANLPGHTLMSVTRGLCVDVVDGSVSAGARAELWECTGGKNQDWQWQSESGLVLNPAADLCLAAC